MLFYSGLLSTVVSAHFNNDTSHDGDELDINTTLSTLPSTTISVSKNCVLEMKENEISKIVELFNSNLVNVVVIHISFSNGSHEGELLSDFNVSLSNPIGREILYALERSDFRYFQWTLKAGIRNFKLNVKGSHNDCIKTGKNALDFVLESTQHIVDSVNLTINYHVCSFFKETLSGKVKQTCCQVTTSSLNSKFNYKCPKGSSFLFESNVPWTVIFYVMFLFALLYLAWLLSVFQSRTEFKLEYPEYHKLEESMMSPSTISFKVIWDENGRVVSFIRSLVLEGVFSYSCYLMWCTGEQNTIISIIFTFFLVIGELSFLVSNLFRSKTTDTMTSEIPKILKILKQHNLYMKDLRMISKKGKRARYFESVVKIIILPFNPNVWKSIIKTLYNDCKAFVTYKTRRFRNRTLKTLALCFYSVLALLICFVCVSIQFCLLISFSIFYPVMTLSVRLLYAKLTYAVKYRDRFLVSLSVAASVIPSTYSILIISFSIVSFLLGLFLNLFYFIPYIAFFSVLTFYCSTYWKTLEEKYFVLKQLIYEACQETQNINNIPNRHPKPSEKVLPVVSSKLYDKIREEFLPYDTNLFYFGLKMFWAIAFSLGILALINMFNEFNVTGLVQVVTTASLGVMPHIFNMVGSKTSEAKTKAHNEDLKLNVKYMVQELIRENPELARTVLIMEQDLDDYKRPAHNLLVRILRDLVEILRNPFYLYRPDNNYAEDCEQGPLLPLQEINTTTNDEDTENSEHFETMFGISFSDNDDVKNIEPTDRTRTVRRNNETTDENGQNSENALGRFEANSNKDDFEDDETDRIESVHTGPGSNPDNTDIEDNGLSPSAMVDGNDEMTTAENAHARQELNHDNTDDIEDNGMSPTVMVDGNHETTTVENAHARPESNHNNDIEENGLHPIVMVDRNHEATTDENDHVRPQSNPNSTDDIEDNGLPPIMMVDGNQETTTDENEHVRPESNHDNDIEDNGLSPTVIVDGNHETSTDENAHARLESNSDNTDDIEDNGLSLTVIVDWNHGGRNYENVENSYASFKSHPDKDDVKDDEQAPIVVAHRNDATNDENCQTVYVMPDLNPNDTQALTMLTIQQDDVEDDEQGKDNDATSNNTGVVEENIQNESNLRLIASVLLKMLSHAASLDEKVKFSGNNPF